LLDANILTFDTKLRQTNAESVEQNGNLLLTLYLTLGSDPVRIQVHESDNVDELAHSFVSYCVRT
jgi:hypothetical protein